MKHFQIKDIESKTLSKGIDIKVIPGKKMTLVFFYLEPGTIVPEHAHPHEQIGTVLKGAIEVKIEEKKFIAKAGDAYHIPSESIHSGKTLETSEILEVFSPPREDYAKM